ncbi:tetratricopeptide repeat protein [Rhodovibrionaceae bacterium A322]
MSDIFREVDEDVRKEQYLQLWKKYGNYVIGAAAAIVIGVGGWQAWLAYQESERLAASEAYYQAMTAVEQSDDSRAALDNLSALAKPGDVGYGQMAAFQEAQLRAKAGDLDGALALWDAIAADSPDNLTRDVAILTAAQHRLNAGETDGLAAKLAPLTDPSNSLKSLAGELLALLAIKEGDLDTARQELQAIVDDTQAAQGVRGRAAQLLASLSE